MSKKKKKVKMGDVVILNSGGPQMTVIAVDNTAAGELYIQYFNTSIDKSGY